MYLSRLVLNPRSRQVQRENVNVYQLHRTVMRAFPEELPAEERVLFRLETAPRTGVPTLLVQSISQPDWEWLAELPQQGYLLPLADEPNPWVKPFEPAFTAGQRLVFRLRANPTVKRVGKRHGLYREDQQLDWLQRQARQGGFTVEAARTQDRGYVEGYTRQQHKLRLLTVQFDGVLRVDNPDQFQQTLRAGIGPGKGLGLGMLSVAPV